MTEPYIGPERRSSEQAWATFAKQLANLHSDVGDIKSGMQDFKEGMKDLSHDRHQLAVLFNIDYVANQHIIEMC